MQSQRAILAILLIFGAGMVAGFFLGRPARPVGTSVPSHSKSGKSAQIFQLSVKDLVRELNLNPVQEKEIRKIYVGHRERLKAVLSKDIRKDVREEVNKRDDEIRAVLTAKQKEEFGKLPGMRRPSGKPKPSEKPSKPAITNDPPLLPDSPKGNSTVSSPEDNSTDN